MGFLAGLALLLLGLHLIGEGLSSVKGKRYLLARAFSRPGSLLLSGLLLGLLSGSGTGLSLLALGLLEGGIFSLGQAHRLLVQTGVRYLPVVDGGRYRGMVGERYLRPFLAPWAPASVQAQWEAPVARFLQEFPKAHPEESPEEAAFRMEAARVGALPVVEEEVLVGLVRAFDLLRGLLDHLRPGAPASPLEVLVPDLPRLRALLEALEATRTPLLGLHLFREAGGLGFRTLLYVGALDLRSLLAHLEALGLRPIRP